MSPKTILVTGASGYIASRLIPRLLDAGYHVRCLARTPERLQRRPWFPRVEMAAGDVTRPATLPAALAGVDAAYYLIHSMAAGEGYDRLDLQSARHFARAAQEAGVEHIIYLGGLANPDDPQLASHLRSRIESGAALREGQVPAVTEFRAGIIVGSGSVSFEMIRFIAEQFPLMVGPRWLRHKSQPIAAVNVLDYLMAALTTPECRGQVIELGSNDTLTYIDVMREYARLRGLKRAALLLPLIPAWFMAFFIDLLTPVDHSYALPLVEGLQNDSVITDPTPLRLFPAIKILNYTESVCLALAETHPDNIERIWLDQDRDEVQIKHEGMFVDYRRFSGVKNLPIFDSPKTGGFGVRYNLVEIQTPGLLRLKAEPFPFGESWLEWQIIPRDGESRLEQTVFFRPKGLLGFLYWYLLSPLHRARFASWLRQ